MSDTEPSWYQRWLATDPLLPGVSYVVVFSGGALGGMLAPELAALFLGFYILIAFGANIGAGLERKTHGRETNREGGEEK